jgi:hypothetical protein
LNQLQRATEICTHREIRRIRATNAIRIMIDLDQLSVFGSQHLGVARRRGVVESTADCQQQVDRLGHVCMRIATVADAEHSERQRMRLRKHALALDVGEHRDPHGLGDLQHQLADARTLRSDAEHDRGTNRTVARTTEHVRNLSTRCEIRLEPAADQRRHPTRQHRRVREVDRQADERGPMRLLIDDRESLIDDRRRSLGSQRELGVLRQRPHHRHQVEARCAAVLQRRTSEVADVRLARQHQHGQLVSARCGKASERIQSARSRRHRNHARTACGTCVPGCSIHSHGLVLARHQFDAHTIECIEHR